MKHFMKFEDRTEKFINTKSFMRIIFNVKISQSRVVSYTHPPIIFNVDICSLLNKVFHCVYIACSSCSVQRSPLICREKETNNIPVMLLANVIQ